VVLRDSWHLKANIDLTFTSANGSQLETSATVVIG
jgi:hypothetical protein